MPGESKHHYLLLYGSQTGQAKAIAEEICERSSQHGLVVDLYCLSQTDKKFSIERERCVVIVTSTTGDGEPPDTAQKFVRRINKKTLPDDHLAHLNYTVLGLGDTNYTNFCNNAKNIDRRLQELGAKRFYPSGFADEAVGLEVLVDPWIDGLFPALQRFLGCAAMSVTSADVEQFAQQPVVVQQKESGVRDEDLATKMSEQNGVQISSDTILTANNVQETFANADILNSLSVSAGMPTKNQNILLSAVGIACSGDNAQTSDEAPPSQVVCDVPDTTTDVALGGDGISNNHSMVGHTACSGISRTEDNLPDGVKESSLQASAPPLSKNSLTLPAVTPAFLAAEYLPVDEDLPRKLYQLPWQNNMKLPSAACDVIMAKIVSAKRLTSDEAVKKTLLIQLDVGDKLEYQPGDSISVICSNTVDEVNQIIGRLDLQAVADLPLRLSVMPDTQKRRAAIPLYFPEELSSLRYILSSCVDLREVPKKALLRVMTEYTSDAEEKRRLQELCSKEGADDYTIFLRNENVSLLDILHAFPSCHPPVERLLEHLPRLQPRPYSACSCKGWSPGLLDITFNVVEIPTSPCRAAPRRGLCTGWLDDITKPLQNLVRSPENNQSTKDLSVQLTSVQLSEPEIRIFARTNQHFRAPNDLSIPIIMIGPGTGVAPFIGFLQERYLQRMKMADKASYGETWLLFGCRYKDKDFLFRSEMEEFQRSGTLTKLLLSFSRDEPPDTHARYVQDNIRLHAANICHLLDEENAVIYVCGDAKNMAKDVNSALSTMLQEQKGVSHEEAQTYLMKLKIHHRYLEDVWM